MFTGIFVALLAVDVFAQVAPANRTFGLLEERRNQFEFIPYTPQQRTQVAQTILQMMRIYVNRESKIQTYGKERQDIDPLPKAQDMVARAASLSDKDFHYSLLDIFTPLRDFHTLYLMPGPHSCLANFQAVDYTLTELNGREQVVVKEITQFERVKELSPEYTRISIGDEVLSVDNVPIQEYIRSRLFLAGGANDFGGKRAVLSRMSVRPGSIERPPSENKNVYRLRKYPTNEEYTVTLPWVTGSRDECYPIAKKVADDIRAGRPLREIPVFPTAPTTDRLPMDDFVSPRTITKKTAFPNNFAAVDVIKVDDILDYTIYKPESKNLGVIFLKSFSPEDRNVNRVFQLIRGLLINELRNTNSVVFDIRENGGGIITLPEIIPQLFKRDIVTLQSRALNTRINQNIFNSRNYGRDVWTDAINSTPARNTYTNLVRFTTSQTANSVGPVYTKPVAVFHDGNCYSSCDIFAAMMQDNKVGPVFGEDGQSGAGGANVVNLGRFFNTIDPVTFPAFPFVDRLPERARSDVSLGWRQSVRVRDNAGVLIEDLGVKADRIFRPTQADIQPDVKTYSPFDRIADALAGRS
jgi:hypothetical protein